MAAFTWKLKLPFNLFCFNDFLLLIVLLWGRVSAFLLLYWIESGRFYERDEPDIIFSFCLGNQWHFVDLLKCGQKWWMFSYFRMLTKSHTHAQRDTTAQSQCCWEPQRLFCWRERLCLFSFPQPCISLNESLCVFIFSAFRGLCLEGFIVLGHMMYFCRKACIKSIGCCLCACSLRHLEGVH